MVRAGGEVLGHHPHGGPVPSSQAELGRGVASAVQVPPSRGTRDADVTPLPWAHAPAFPLPSTDCAFQASPSLPTPTFAE